MMEGFKSQMEWKLGRIKEPFGWLSDTERLIHFLSVTRERPQVETSSDLSRCCDWFNHLFILTLKYSVSMKQIRNGRIQERSNFFPAQNLGISLFLSTELTMWYGYQKCEYPCSLYEILPRTVSRIRWSKPVQGMCSGIGIALCKECIYSTTFSERRLQRRMWNHAWVILPEVSGSGHWKPNSKLPPSQGKFIEIHDRKAKYCWF